MTSTWNEAKEYFFHHVYSRKLVLGCWTEEQLCLPEREHWVLPLYLLGRTNNKGTCHLRFSGIRPDFPLRGGGYPLNGRIPLKRKWQVPLHLFMSIYSNADSILLTTKIRTHYYEISSLTSQRLPQPILHGVRQIGGNPAIDSGINRKPKEWVAQPRPKPISPLCQPTVPNESPSASNSQCIAGVFYVCGRCVVTPVNVVRCVNYVYVQKHHCKM